MQGDLLLAATLLRGNKRSVRAAAKRFHARAELAFEHCGEAREDGLSFEAYLEGVLHAAGRSLLRAMPETEDEARLDPHVERLLGRRDFALLLRALAGSELARIGFRERFGEFLESLLFRSGVPAARTSETIDELLDELFRPGERGAPAPLAGYLGRCDLRDWLFVYVREVFRGGLHASFEHVLPGREASDPPPVQAAPPGAEAFFEAALRDLSAADLDLLERVAAGDDLRDEDDLQRAARLTRRREVAERLHERTCAAVARASGVAPAIADGLVKDALSVDVENRLAALLGHPPEATP